MADILKTLVAAALATALASSALCQVPLTSVDGSRLECEDANLGPCLEKFEREVIDAHPGLVRRTTDGWLSIKLENGNWSRVGEECPICDYAIDMLQDGKFLAILAFGEEDIYWKLLNRTNGRITRIEGYPLFSPDGQRIVVSEQDEMNSNALDVYDMSGVDPVRVFRGIASTDNWAPRRLCWVNDTNVSYERVPTDAPHQDAGDPETLTFRAGKWRIETGGPRCALTS